MILKSQVSRIFSRQLRKRIIIQNHAGKKLSNVRKLASDSGLSVPTVLESIKQLEDDGIIRRRQGSGIFVNEIKERKLEVTVLQADYPGYRYEMLTKVVSDYCTRKRFNFNKKIVSLMPESSEELPNFSDVIIYIAPSHPLKPTWLAELDSRCGILAIMDKCPSYVAIDSISIDGEKMIITALEYLFNNGHRDIWYVHNSPNVYDVVIRYFVAAKWAVENGINLSHIDCGVKPGEDGYTKGLSELTKRLKETKRQPSALLTINDVGSLMALEACKINGIKVPEEISIAGLNDCPEAQKSDPPLTVVAAPEEAFANALDDLIQKRIFHKDNQKDNFHLKVKGDLIKRKSVKNIN